MRKAGAGGLAIALGAGITACSFGPADQSDDNGQDESDSQRPTGGKLKANDSGNSATKEKWNEEEELGGADDDSYSDPSEESNNESETDLDVTNDPDEPDTQPDEDPGQEPEIDEEEWEDLGGDTAPEEYGNVYLPGDGDHYLEWDDYTGAVNYHVSVYVYYQGVADFIIENSDLFLALADTQFLRFYPVDLNDAGMVALANERISKSFHYELQRQGFSNDDIEEVVLTVVNVEDWADFAGGEP